ncbi:sulfurtransferase [Halorubellus sp. JP-L1]|uniref:sulfurtransferase n=1 Tax=Halorubellus sp. JP-L1 TaxID=2715753 RepID=UPI001409157B|nr:sulfurtransferase [Halorubellus sp. JP-L1]NHN43366.1 sulfurtransferase [Halorubellus sp. JP-L1]
MTDASHDADAEDAIVDGGAGSDDAITDGATGSGSGDEGSTGSGDGRRVPWVVDADWLATHAADPDVSVVDVRDAWEYDGIGHVPEAVNVPFDSFRSDGDDDVGMLPGADRWAQVMRDAGVARDDVLVAYDDTHGVFAARFLVTALMYGHRDVALLDGDYAAYNRDHPTTTDAPDAAATDYEASVPDDRPLIDADAVAALLDGDRDSVVFVDTRDDGEYEDGHLPGAVNLDWKALVDDETRGLLPEPELHAILDAHGITSEKRVALYCNTARRISHTYVVLRDLGYDRVDFFEGSLTEWRDRDGALETGD